MFKSVLLISSSSLFHSVIACGKKEFWKISVLHSVASLALYAQNFAGAMKKNAAPKFTKRHDWTLHKI